METLRYEVRQQVAHIVLDHAATRNALGTQMRDELAAAIRSVKADSEHPRRGDHRRQRRLLRGRRPARHPPAPTLDSDGWRERMQDAHAWLRDADRARPPGDRRGGRRGLRRRLQPGAGGRLRLVTPRARFCLSFMRHRAGARLRRLLHPAAHRRRAARQGADAVGPRSGAPRRRWPGHRDGAARPPEQLLPRAQALAASFARASPLAVSLVKRASPPTRATWPAARDRSQRPGAVLRHARRTARRCSDFLDKQPPAFQWPARTGQASETT